MIIQNKINQCVLHDKNNIKGFFVDFRWLSNFHLCPVSYEGQLFPSSEHAYQAAKIIPESRQYLINVSSGQVKKEWKKYTLLDKDVFSWDNRKLGVMKIILMDKFTRNDELRYKLLDTEDKYLEETNWWGDKFWGVCENEGENNLGKLLMEIRLCCKNAR